MTGLILTATLFPVAGAERVPTNRCIICGSRGGADAILNVLLFVPLGAALGWRRSPLWRAAVCAGLLSLGIEIAQVVVPGRDPSWGDLLFNTVGGALGWAGVHVLPGWLRVGGARRVRWWAGAVIAGAGILLVSSTLMEPAFPRATYFGQRAVELPFPWYQFHVLDARVGDESLPAARFSDSERLWRTLQSGPDIEIRAAALPPIPITRRVIGIYDDQLREFVRLGAKGNDLELRYRMNASAIRFDRPGFRFPDVLRGVRAGDTVQIVVSGTWWRPCVRVDEVRRCSHAVTAGSGWNVLFSVDRLAGWSRAVANMVWIFAIFFPAGLWAPDLRRAVLGGGVLVAVLALVPLAVDVAPTPAHQLIAGALGVAAGYGLGSRFQSRGHGLRGARLSRRESAVAPR